MGENLPMAKDKRPARAGALTADDWIQAAATAIAERGVGAVAVEPLAQRLGVTKGSFYWHFPNREALLKATLAHWEAEGTEAVIAALDRIADPRQRLERLVAAAFTVPEWEEDASPRSAAASPAFTLAVADAADDPVVQPTLRRVSERRVDYLEACFRALGLAPDEARFHALLGYATFVGTLRLAREAPSRLPRQEEYRAYRRHVIATILPEDGSGCGTQPPAANGQREAST